MLYSIRPFEPRDSEVLLRVFRTSVAVLGSKAYHPHQISAWSASAGDADSFRKRLSRGFTVVAERDGQAFAFGQLHPANVVDMLYCDPTRAGTGVGGRLLAALETCATDMGQVVIDTKASLVAYGFFASHGYQSICEEVVTRNGVAISRHSMRKLLVAGKRWSIIGKAGSGKTTLATKIASLTGAAVLDLNTIAGEPNTTSPDRRPTDKCREFIGNFCSRHEHWVVEGCHEDLIAETLPFDPCLLWLRTRPDENMARCGTREFEAHEYTSPMDQGAALPTSVGRVAASPHREGLMSETSHRALYEKYDGRKHEVLTEADTARATSENGSTP